MIGAALAFAALVALPLLAVLYVGARDRRRSGRGLLGAKED